MKVPSGTIKNNGKITFCYSETEKYCIPRGTFKQCIRKLIDVGFIDIAEASWQGKPTYYSISERWEKYGTPDYKKPNRNVGRSGWFKKPPASL